MRRFFGPWLVSIALTIGWGLGYDLNLRASYNNIIELFVSVSTILAVPAAGMSWVLTGYMFVQGLHLRWLNYELGNADAYRTMRLATLKLVLERGTLTLARLSELSGWPANQLEHALSDDSEFVDTALRYDRSRKVVLTLQFGEQKSMLCSECGGLLEFGPLNRLVCSFCSASPNT